MKTDGHWISFSYTLTYDEAFDAFLLLAARGRKGHRDTAAVLLIALASALTVLYGFNPYHLEYSFLAFLALATFWGVVYYPKMKARSGAKRVAALQGLY